MRALFFFLLLPLSLQAWPPTRKQLEQTVHTAACVSGAVIAYTCWQLAQKKAEIEKQHMHLVNYLTLANPAKQQQRANIVSRANTLTKQLHKVRKKQVIYAAVLGIHLVYAGIYAGWKLAKWSQT